MHGRFAAKSLHRPLQRCHAPIAHFLEIDVERRLVELDDIDACRLDRERLFIENLRKDPGQLLPASIMVVVERVDHRHRSRQGVFGFALGHAAQELRVLDIDRMTASHRAHDHRHIGVVTVANPHCLAVLEIHAVEVLDEGRHEMTTCLLTIADDIDAGRLLVGDSKTHRVALALGEPLAFEQPGRPELIGRGKPGRLGKAPRNGGLQEWHRSFQRGD